MRRLIAVTAAIGLGVTGLATAGTASAGTTTKVTTASSNTVPVTPSSVNWGTCADPRLASRGAVCGLLDVPLDYSKPNGTKIQLALSMLRHTTPDSQYQGIMLVNPGGPGGSGEIYSVFRDFIPNGAGQSYDWIGFDPRGVGSSVPSLSCIPDYFQGPRPNYTPVNHAVEKAWLDRSAAYATACGQNGGDLLDHVTTVDSAKDMNSIREAMGQQQLNYLGFSYGTYLGSVFGTLFPNRLRRAVFDSTVDPTRVFYQANLDQDIAFEKNIKIWFGWVAKYDSVYHLGTTEAAVQKLWYNTQQKLFKDPAGGVVGGDEWADIFLYAGYYQQTWLDLGDAFSAYVNNHDVARIVGEYEDAEGVGDDNGFAMYLATQCTDAPWPQNYAKIKRDNLRVAKNHPFFTWGNAWFNGPCLGWPGDARQSAVKVDGSKVKSVLMVDETLDAATPYGGSLEVRKLFPGASLIALPGGTSHANSLNGDACLDDQIASYLADGTLPPRKPGNRADTTCQPLPVPDPTEAAAAQAQAQPQAKATTTGALTRQSLDLPLMRP
jgi:pimeloyl-ACP methyl ester carboxylesterase